VVSTTALLQGHPETPEWQDKDGKDNYTSEIAAEHMQVHSRRGWAHPHTCPHVHSLTHMELSKKAIALLAFIGVRKEPT
jgi:single-stranded DNA-binding protein